MKKILILFVLTAIFLAGCTVNFGNTQPLAVAGVFKSYDSGNTWVPKNLFLHSGGAGSIAGVDVLSLTFDPQDNRAVYLASKASGLLYTYDSGDSWVKARAVGDFAVESVAIDSKNKCIIYITRANTVLKSVDCSRSWVEIYTDTRSSANLTAIAVDQYNNSTIYAGNSEGDILKSVDGGTEWRAIKRLDDRINKILIDENDTRVIYVATKSKGIFKTITAGADWLDINDGLKQYSGALEYRNLIFDESTPDSLMLVAKYGLIKTLDGGTTWQSIKLITPPATTDIYSVAINPSDNQEIYYATKSTFYKTLDGGQNWITKKLPTNTVPTFLLIDPAEPNVIYMGLTNVNKK